MTTKVKDTRDDRDGKDGQRTPARCAAGWYLPCPLDKIRNCAKFAHHFDAFERSTYAKLYFHN